MRGLLASLSGVVFLRVLGVSLLLAGFLDHARGLGASTVEAGFAFGAYPLALALFMLPLAALSDRLGRRPVLLGGLAVGAAGGVAAAFAPTVALLAAARFVQGAGAVNGVVLALVGEMAGPERRTRRFALVGAAAGLGFVAGLLLGALLDPVLGVPGLLLLHSLATVLVMVPLANGVPVGRPSRGTGAALSLRAGAPVVALGMAAFAVNAVLTGLLFLSPDLLANAPWPYAALLLVMVLPGGLGMFLASRLADRGLARAVGLGGALLLGAAPLAFLLPLPVAAVVAGGMLFFVGHSSLSALLPSLLATVASEEHRGAAQGLQSTLQYLGSFVGSALAAWAHPSVPLLAALFLAAGLVVASSVALTTRRGVSGVSSARA